MKSWGNSAIVRGSTLWLVLALPAAPAQAQMTDQELGAPIDAPTVVRSPAADGYTGSFGPEAGAEARGAAFPVDSGGLGDLGLASSRGNAVDDFLSSNGIDTKPSKPLELSLPPPEQLDAAGRRAAAEAYRERQQDLEAQAAVKFPGTDFQAQKQQNEWLGQQLSMPINNSGQQEYFDIQAEEQRIKENTRQATAWDALKSDAYDQKNVNRALNAGISAEVINQERWSQGKPTNVPAFGSPDEYEQRAANVEATLVGLRLATASPGELGHHAVKEGVTVGSGYVGEVIEQNSRDPNARAAGRGIQYTSDVVSLAGDTAEPPLLIATVPLTVQKNIYKDLAQNAETVEHNNAAFQNENAAAGEAVSGFTPQDLVAGRADQLQNGSVAMQTQRLEALRAAASGTEYSPPQPAETEGGEHGSEP